MKIAILGVGGLGSALAQGLAGGAHALVVCDRNASKTSPFHGKAQVISEPVAAVAGADVVLLVVKPKGTVALAQAIAGGLAPDALVVSCAAGIPLAALAAAVGATGSAASGPVTARALARAMPNIGAAHGQSTTGVALGGGCVRPRDSDRLQQVFTAVGTVREVDEGWLHAVAAVGASGPAFLLLAMEALVDAGVEQGLPRADALAFARGALVAAAARVTPGVEPAAVRATVTSPAGITAAGLALLERASVRAAFQDAVRAATERSKELSKA